MYITRTWTVKIQQATSIVSIQLNTCVTTPNVITYTKCNTNHKCNKKSTPNVIPTTNVIKKLHQM